MNARYKNKGSQENVSFGVRGKLWFGFAIIMLFFVLSIAITLFQVSSTKNYSNKLSNMINPLVQNLTTIKSSTSAISQLLAQPMNTQAKIDLSSAARQLAETNASLTKLSTLPNEMFNSLKISQLKVYLTEINSQVNGTQSSGTDNRADVANQLSKMEVFATSLLSTLTSPKDQARAQNLVNGLTRMTAGAGKDINVSDIAALGQSLQSLKANSQSYSRGQQVLLQRLSQSYNDVQMGMSGDTRSLLNTNIANLKKNIRGVDNLLVGKGGILVSSIALQQEYSQELAHSLKILEIEQWTLLVIGLVVGLLIAYLMADLFYTPIRFALNLLNKLIAGDRDMIIESDAKDEFGLLFEKIAVLQDSLQEGGQTSVDGSDADRAILDSAIDPVVMIDKIGTILFFNKAAEKFWLYSSDEVMGKNVKMLMPHEYAVQHDQFLQNYQDTGIKKVLGVGREVKAKRNDGVEVDIFLSLSEAQSGGKTVFTAIIKDLTEINAEKERSSAILNNAIDSIISIDKIGTISFFNKAAEAFWGYSQEDVIGKNVKMLMPDSFANNHDGFLSAYDKTGVKNVLNAAREVVAKRADGVEVPILLSLSEVVLADGDKVFTAIIKDLTEINAAKERTEGILEGSIDPIITITEMGIITYANSVTSEFWGYSLDEMIGQNVKMLMPKNFAMEHDGYLKNYRDTGVKKVIGMGREVVAHRKDGKEIPVFLSLSEMRVGGERFFTGIIKDISDIKQAQEEMAKSEAAQRDMLADLKERIELFLSLVEKIAEGDLTKKIEVTGDDDLASLGSNLLVMQENLNVITLQLKGSTKTMLTSIQELEASATQQYAGTQEATSSITECTSIIDEIRSATEQTAEKADDMMKTAEDTKVEGLKGVGTVEKTANDMVKIDDNMHVITEATLLLSEKTQRISEMANSITTIAANSKMLALNATIEASKAGELGKGFAVVADEVKVLAEESEKAAELIQHVLLEIQAATDKAVMAVEEGAKVVVQGKENVSDTGKTMTTLLGVIEDSVDKAIQIGTAVNQVKTGIEQVHIAMGEMNKAATQSAQSTEEMKQATVNLAGVASGLEESVSKYKVDETQVHSNENVLNSEE